MKQLRFKLSGLLFFIMVISVSTSLAQESLMQKMADRAFREGDFEKAALYYREVLKTDMSLGASFNNYIGALYKLEQYAELDSFLTDRTERFPQIATYQIQKARLLYKTSQTEHARELLFKTCRNFSRLSVFQQSVLMLKEQRLFGDLVELVKLARNTLNSQVIFAGEMAEGYLFLNQYEKATLAFIVDLLQNPAHYSQNVSQIKSYASIDQPEILQQVLNLLQLAKESKGEKDKILLIKLLTDLYETNAMYEAALKEERLLDYLLKANGRLLFLFAEKMRRENQIKTAISAYNETIKNSSHPTFLQKSKYWKAVLSLESARRFPELGISTTEAINIANRYLTENPKMSDQGKLYLALARVYASEQDQSQSALEFLEKLSKGNANRAVHREAQLLKADILYHQLKFEPSEALFQQLMLAVSRQDQNYDHVLWRLGQLSFFKTDFKAALNFLKQISHQSPESNNAIDLKLFILEGISDTLHNSNMIEALKEAVVFFFPNHPYGVDSTISQMESWLDRFPQSSLQDNLFYKLGRLSEEKYPQKALAAFAKIQTTFPDSYYVDHALFQQAAIYDFNLKNSTRALVLYRQLLEKFPKSIFVKQARARISVLMNPS